MQKIASRRHPETGHQHVGPGLLRRIERVQRHGDYQQAQQQWSTSQQDMNLVLQEAGRFVQQAEEAYRAADRAVQKNFSAAP